MAESYSVRATLSAVDNGFTSTLKRAMGVTDSLGSKLKGGFSFGLITGAGQKAFGMLASGAKGLISDIADANSSWKTFAGNMKILGKGEKEIEGVKKELQDFAAKTVYSAADMSQTYAQLAAVGVKNTDKLVMGFGGLAAASENPQQAMKTLSQQATQMAAKPTVAGQDFKLMLEQTPAGIASVAKQMGMSTSELVSAVQNGTVKTDEFFEAIQKGFQVTWQMARMMFEFLGQLIVGLFGGAKPEGELIGPVGFVQEMSMSIESGFRTMLLMVSMATLNLGIANLLPIPGLDGGRCLFVFYELIFRRRVNPEREGLLNAIGICLMFGLIILISVKDVFFR